MDKYYNLIAKKYTKKPLLGSFNVIWVKEFIHGKLLHVIKKLNKN